ncbi:Retrotransposon gag domain [Sesbania bispinosa]|nr:Retrotransposon gag domain [Sesbania bispinosa]
MAFSLFSYFPMTEGPQSWHIAGVEGYQGRGVGSPPLAWGDVLSVIHGSLSSGECQEKGWLYEFERLEQTEGMSVSEYNTRFTQLSRHAPYPITEEMRVKDFLSSGRRRKEAVAEILAKNRWSVGSPPLAWGEFSRLFMARFLPESVREGLAHEFERLEQTEGLREYIFRSVVRSNCSTFAEVLSLALQLEQRQKEKGGSGRDSRKKQRVEGSQSWHIAGLRDIRAVELASFQLAGVAHDSFDTVTRGREGLAHEFERLEQTEGMSVSEYNARFTQLSRHAPYPITEEMRVKRFVRGLREYVFRSVVRSNCSTFAEVLSLALQLEQRQKEKGGRLRDIRAVELASFQLEGVAYDSFDTMTHGRSVGSPPLAWGEFSRLFMARFLPESVREGLAHEFERLEQTEAAEGEGAVAEILARNRGLRDRRVGISQVGSPPLAWGEFSRLFMARFLPESVREGLAHEFERLEQTEEEMRVKRFVRGLREYVFRFVVRSNCSTFAEVLSLALQLEQRQKEKGGSGRDSRKNRGLRDRRVGISQEDHWITTIGLGEFSRLFMARFLPESVREGLAHEFERLEQTEGMSVSEYNSRFTQLSRHAPYPITEEMRVKRFVRGLREYIFRSVVRSNSSTFAEVLSLALQLEQRQKEKGGSGRDSRKKQRVEGSQSWHIAESVREGLALEFERLEQTEGMSVPEYNARFTQLSRHAPYPITEEMRVKRFVRGLREYIFRSVVRSNCSTFAEVLSLALQLEQRQKEKGGSGRDSRKTDG